MKDRHGPVLFNRHVLTFSHIHTSLLYALGRPGPSQFIKEIIPKKKTGHPDFKVPSQALRSSAQNMQAYYCYGLLQGGIALDNVHSTNK